ncbi:Uncharacterised protein [Cedecea neteri]|uniref:Uncharacterized protein n=1 Tax=Cedecea neteri TaxID=158822 RepID=A0A2X2STI0_9ENTR|nr:Uncharacterised protein [Cedecea neteri]
MKCILVSPDAAFNNTHLILWDTSLSRWPNALQSLLEEMSAHDEPQTTTFGLQGICERLSLLPSAEIAQPAVLRQLLSAAETLVPSPVLQPVALDLAGFNLADETTFVRLRTLLIAFLNRFYQLPQLGYREDELQSNGELWLITEPNNALARRLASQAEAIAQGMLLSRQLADLPALDCRPQDVALQAETWAHQHPQTQW